MVVAGSDQTRDDNFLPVVLDGGGPGAAGGRKRIADKKLFYKGGSVLRTPDIVQFVRYSKSYRIGK